MMSTSIFAMSFIGELIGDIVGEDSSDPHLRRVVRMFGVCLAKGNVCIGSTSCVISILNMTAEFPEKL